MGSFDGSEVCEFVGLYLLDILGKEFGDNKIGLFRDDGLSCFQNLSGPESECNLRITDFLDITFDLRTRKY